MTREEALEKARAAKKINQIEPETEKTEPEPAPTVIAATDAMTSDEKAIFSRIMSDDKEWATIDQYATLDYSLAEDPFKLPKPAMDLENSKQFKFIWITRSPERLDAVKNASVPRRWWPVNRMQPVGDAFRKFVDGSTGAVHLLDQMLVFKPWWMWEKEQQIEEKLADMRGDLTARDDEVKNDLRLAAVRRKEGEPRQRAEISGSDIHFRGEADVDGSGYDPASDADLVVNE